MIKEMYSMTLESGTEKVHVHLLSDLIDIWDPSTEELVPVNHGGYQCKALTDAGFERYMAAMEEARLDDPVHVGTIINLSMVPKMLGLDGLIGDGDGNYIGWTLERTTMEEVEG